MQSGLRKVISVPGFITFPIISPALNSNLVRLLPSNPTEVAMYNWIVPVNVLTVYSLSSPTANKGYFLVSETAEKPKDQKCGTGTLETRSSEHFIKLVKTCP